MSNRYASGPKALGICDRCGRTYLLDELKFETKNYKRDNIRVCPSCFDIQNPQDLPDLFDGGDTQALRNPRPDTGLEASRTVDLAAWNDKYGGDDA